jgi:chaperone modulatory protein CbpM
MGIDEDGFWLHAHHQVTIVELAEFSGFPEPLLRELVEYGALSPVDPAAPEWKFGADCVAEVRAAARLREDLELETPAVALALSLLRRIERMEAEMRALRAQLVRPRG